MIREVSHVCSPILIWSYERQFLVWWSGSFFMIFEDFKHENRPCNFLFFFIFAHITGRLWHATATCVESRRLQIFVNIYTNSRNQNDSIYMHQL